MTKARELQQRISVQRTTAVSDGMGGQDITWSNIYPSLPAKVRPVKGREAQHLGRTVSVETYLIVIRFGPDITAKDRIVWGGKELDIRTAQDRDGDRRWLTIEAEAGFGT